MLSIILLMCLYILGELRQRVIEDKDKVMYKISLANKHTVKFLKKHCHSDDSRFIRMKKNLPYFLIIREC